MTFKDAYLKAIQGYTIYSVETLRKYTLWMGYLKAHDAGSPGLSEIFGLWSLHPMLAPEPQPPPRKKRKKCSNYTQAHLTSLSEG